MNKIVGYLGAVLALLGSMLGVGRYVGRLENQIAEQERRIGRLENEQRFLHGQFDIPGTPASHVNGRH